ncbi:hypothetical protein YC2023_101443 [Brassica napus]
MLLHKMSETSRTIYRAPASSLESCCFISETEYLSGSDRNALLKKKPVFLLKNAHSVVAGVITTNGSDFAVSGAGNGFVHLMVVEASALWIFIQASTDKKTGFVNSMAFAKSGKFLIAGVGQNCYGFCDINMLQETRFGRWGCIKSAQNGELSATLENILICTHPNKVKQSLLLDVPTPKCHGEEGSSGQHA